MACKLAYTNPVFVPGNMFKSRSNLVRKGLKNKCIFRFFTSSGIRYQDIHVDSKKHLLVSVVNGVKRITLNDVKKRNALSLSLLNELKTELIESSRDHNVSAVILGHTGPAFSAGHDLKELTEEMGSEYHTKVFQTCSEVMNLVQDICVPVIAEINGVATAAGCQLVATCDLAVASEKSIFAAPGVYIGLFCSTPGVAIARSVSRKQALKMLLTGESISASEALQTGLVNQIVPEENLADITENLAKKIIQHSRAVIALGKETFYKQIRENRDAAYCLTENVMVQNLKHPDAQEGIDAFFRKRKPKWTT